MTKGDKSGVVSDASKGKDTTEEKGKRSSHRTRIGRDFDPKSTMLHNQKDIDEYLVKYGVELSPGIKVEAIDDEVRPQRSGLEQNRPLPIVGAYVASSPRV